MQCHLHLTELFKLKHGKECLPVDCCLEGHTHIIQKSFSWEFPGGLVVRTPCFHCQGPGSESLVRELRSCKLQAMAKKKKKRRRRRRRTHSLYPPSLPLSHYWSSPLIAVDAVETACTQLKPSSLELFWLLSIHL